MAEPKTKPTNNSVDDFLASLGDEQKIKDSHTLIGLMQQITSEPPKMWGPSIIGFGAYHYTYKSGREGDWMLIGFSPRKAALTVYLMDGLEAYRPLLDKLGPHTTSKGCLYIKRLSDIDIDVLRDVLQFSVKNVKSGSFLL